MKQFVAHPKSVSWVIFLHESLKWDLQVNKIVKNCHNPLKIISCLRRTWWGADPNLLKNLYIVLIRSRLDYGCFFFRIWNFHKELSSTESNSLRLPPRDFKKHWQDLLYQEFKDWSLLIGESKGSFYTKNYLNLRRKPWFHKRLLNRKTIVSHTALKDCKKIAEIS